MKLKLGLLRYNTYALSTTPVFSASTVVRITLNCPCGEDRWLWPEFFHPAMRRAIRPQRVHWLINGYSGELLATCSSRPHERNRTQRTWFSGEARTLLPLARRASLAATRCRRWDQYCNEDAKCRFAIGQHRVFGRTKSGVMVSVPVRERLTLHQKARCWDLNALIGPSPSDTA